MVSTSMSIPRYEEKSSMIQLTCTLHINLNPCNAMTFSTQLRYPTMNCQQNQQREQTALQQKPFLRSSIILQVFKIH